MATPLQYFQPSPVRGQLEPPDATTRPGWRYLQCTDTPNELKGARSPIFLSATTDPGTPVLLPPRASQVYAYLLSQEQVELARGAEASWERLMHVRHLKDRMISELLKVHCLRACVSTCYREMQAPGSHQPWPWQGGSIPHSICSFRFYSQGMFVLGVGPNNSLNRVLGTREMVQE